MAKIKGIELKKLVWFKGHEGESCAQGDIHIDGKKSGYFSDHPHGGEMTLRFDTDDAKATYVGRVREYFTEHPEQNTFDGEPADSRWLQEHMMWLLTTLDMMEKKFKQKEKQWSKDPDPVKPISLLLQYEYDTEMAVCPSEQDASELLAKKKSELKYHLVFRSVEDFNIK